MPGENENLRNISHCGIKEAQGFVQRSIVGVGMGGGILGAPLNPDPHARGPKAPVYSPDDRRPPRGDPASIPPRHNPAPHRYAADPGPRESVVLTPRTRP